MQCRGWLNSGLRWLLELPEPTANYCLAVSRGQGRYRLYYGERVRYLAGEDRYLLRQDGKKTKLNAEGAKLYLLA